MSEQAPTTQESPEERQSRLTEHHMNYQRSLMEMDKAKSDKEQQMKDRIQNASPDDIHWAMNIFEDRNIGARLYLKDKVLELAEARGLNDFAEDDYDARDALFEEITETTDYGRKLLESEDDNRKSLSASRLLGEWHSIPEDSRGTFSSYISSEMIKARAEAANQGTTERLDEVSAAGEWCGKYLRESLRDYYNSGFDRTDEVHWDSYVAPEQGQVETFLSQDRLEHSKQVHQKRSISS